MSNTKGLTKDAVEESIKSAYTPGGVMTYVPTPKTLIKSANFVNGVTALGSKLSLQSSKNNELEATAFGVKATSKSTGRIVLIPWSNVSGCELFNPDLKVEKPVINAPPRNLVNAKI